MKPNPRKKVAAYIRVSGPGQITQDSYGPEIQRQAISAFALSQNWEIVDWYEDLAITGGDLERPELQRMISEGQQGKYDLVLVHRIDRVSRSLRDLLRLTEDYLPGLKSVSESFIDTSTPEGRAMFQVLGTFAELDKNQTVTKLHRGRLEKHQQGGFSVGQVATGYASIDGKLTVVNPFSKLIKRIYHMFIFQGMGLNRIATTLNGEGVRTKNNHRWYARTIRLILENETYTGKVKNGTTNKGIQPLIISRAIWGRAQKKLSMKRCSGIT
jgi:site-specific DNA recombinase